MSVVFPKKPNELKEIKNFNEDVASNEQMNIQDIDDSFEKTMLVNINKREQKKGNNKIVINPQNINKSEINSYIDNVASDEQDLKKNHIRDEAITIKFLDPKMNERYQTKSRKTAHCSLFSITNEISTSIPQNQNAFRKNFFYNLNAFSEIEEMHTLLVHIFQNIKKDKQSNENKQNELNKISENNDEEKANLYIIESSIEL